jgi:hypothetical protein
MGHFWRLCSAPFAWKAGKLGMGEVVGKNAQVNQYQQLDQGAVGDTVEGVRARIVARFPDRDLGDVATEVGAAVKRAAMAGRPPPLRRVARAVCFGLAGLVGVATVAAILIVIRDAFRAARGRASFDWLPLIESAVNDVAFAGIAVVFLLTMSSRLDRRAILRELHGLRSLAHVIDMHQLTKDPERYLSQPTPTEASIIQTMTPSDLGRYLDYCSELLSLVAKTAALYAQISTDSLVLDTVSEIESLTSGLSRKIWQKISLLHG